MNPLLLEQQDKPEETYFERQESSPFWLTGLRYLEEKKSVLAEFSCAGFKRTAILAFFPCFLVSKKALSKESLKNEISLLGNQKFELIEIGDCFKVVSTNFSMLETLANNVFKSTGALAIMPSPERQFLIEKNWGFFDAFCLEETSKGIVPAKAVSFGLPDVKTDFFSESLPKTISALSKIDPEEANSILSLIAFSKILFLPLEKIPATGFLKQEIFLENLFFRNNVAPLEIHKQELKEDHALQASFFFRGTPEFDIAPLIPMLLTNACYNIGFETIDCACCNPGNHRAKNLLPSSLAEVEFLKDAFYFESPDSKFSDSFHENNPLKENRLRRKKEFFLNQIPTGPFSRNQFAEGPLFDALSLEQNKDARLAGFKEKHWACLEKESFVSRAILETKSKIGEIDFFLEKSHEKCFSKNNVISGFFSLEKDFSMKFALEYKKSLGFFLANLPAQLSNRESRFFNPVIADAVESIYFGAVHAFSEIKRKPCNEGPCSIIQAHLMAITRQ